MALPHRRSTERDGAMTITRKRLFDRGWDRQLTDQMSDDEIVENFFDQLDTRDYEIRALRERVERAELLYQRAAADLDQARRHLASYIADGAMTIEDELSAHEAMRQDAIASRDAAESERDETLDILVEIEMLCRELAPWIQAHQDDEPDSSWYPRLVRLAIEHHRRIVDTHRRIVDTQAATITNMSSQNANVCAALYAEQDRTNALRAERDEATRLARLWEGAANRHLATLADVLGVPADDDVAILDALRAERDAAIQCARAPEEVRRTIVELLDEERRVNGEESASALVVRAWLASLDSTAQQKASITVCAQCGAADVQITAWVKANTGEVINGEPPTSDVWCPHCETMVETYEEDQTPE